MRSPYLIALIITFVGAGVYWYQSSAEICPVPLSYRLGEIDSSFNIAPKEALTHIKSAEQLWEQEVDRDLFNYDPDAEFVINFVFDERQASADSEESQRQVLDRQKEQNDVVLETVAILQEEHRSLSASYDRRSASYEAKLLKYNEKVTTYDDRGGAPADVFAELEEERLVLKTELKALTDLAGQLNQLATEINQLGERGNGLVADYNQRVAAYNAQFGFEREFTQGDYQGQEINIYKFSSDNELLTVLAHEFGHALSLDHVDEEKSLMYYLLEETDSQPQLTTDDVLAYQTVCGVSESFGAKTRRVIREILAAF